MADQSNQQGNVTDYSNIIQQLHYTGDTQKDIDITLRAILGVLQNNPTLKGLGSAAPRESQSNFAENKWKYDRKTDYDPKKYTGRGNIYDDFTNGFKKQLLDSLAGGNFKKGIQGALNTFTERFGMDIRNIPTEAGRALSKRALDVFNGSKFGKAFNTQAGKLGNWALDKAFGRQGQAGAEAKQSILDMVKVFRNGGQGAGNLSGNLSGTLGKVMNGKGSQILAQGGGKFGAMIAKGGMAKAGGTALAGKGMAVLGKGAAALGPYGLLIAGIIYTVVKVLGPALKGLAEMAKSLGKSFNREEEMRKKMMENAKTRQKADLEYLAEQPFKILQAAAEKWEQTWDANLRKVGQTQGYDKESVYALYEGYAERLREEGYGSVINATDVVDKLSSVLDTGLSGQAAEEFAYIATKLNAAIPTQDFFGYADTYASIAANAISQGKSQEQALSLANAELEQFASNLLYSSRELAGGFSTGLKNSSTLFKNATQIAQSAKTYNSSEISGTLTSVSAIIGSVAPDLADSLVNNVVQAAIGGNNNSQLVALRSLAGVNAGNTDFLKAMAENPQEIFSSLFTNLANMQNMSPDNYMEVAEGLADVFGIDKAAFARVDFNYLASAINAMQVNYDSLDANLALLASGQTTTSAEQLKAQEVNSVILEEGLAYVIDSEAGRMIQQHMWDEQRANAMMENEYAVSLQGSALEFLEGIRKTMTTLMNFLNPVGFITKGIANISKTIAESVGNENDIREILQLGAVGGNAKSFYNLTTRGKNLELTTSLVEMMGGQKGVPVLNQWAKDMGTLGNIVSNATQFLGTGGLIVTPTADEFNKINDSLQKSLGGGNSNAHTGSAVSSRYNWGTVGKSVANAIQNTPINNATISKVVKSSSAATEYAQEQSNKRFEEFLSTAEKASKDQSYEQWVATAKNYGISNYQDALETFGRSENEIRSYFEANEARQGAIIEEDRKKDEELFRKETREYWGFTTNGAGVYQTALWFPFFGDGMKYDTRMDAVDTALSVIQARIGLEEKHTVIGGIEEVSRKLGLDTEFTVISVLENINKNIYSTFVTTSSVFQKCLADWVRYMTESKKYSQSIGGGKTTAWYDLQSATAEDQKQATLALANALGVFTTEQLKNMDPQLQTNVLLGEIVVLLQTIMQQNNNQAGGLSLIDTISALGLGATKK